MRKICFALFTALLAWTSSYAQDSFIEVDVTCISSCAPGDQTAYFDITVDFGEAPEETPEYFYFRLIIENLEDVDPEEDAIFSVNEEIANWVEESGGWIANNPNLDGSYNIILPNTPDVFKVIDADSDIDFDTDQEDSGNDPGDIKPVKGVIGIVCVVETGLDTWEDTPLPVDTGNGTGDGGGDGDGDGGDGDNDGGDIIPFRLAVEGFSRYCTAEGLIELDDSNDDDEVEFVCNSNERLASTNEDLVAFTTSSHFWPNPTNSILNILPSETAKSVNVYDITGNLLISQSLAKVNILSVAELNTGNYIIEFRNNDGTSERQRFIKI